VHGTEHSWKCGTVATIEATETRFRAVDARTCRTLRTVEVPEEASVITWRRNDRHAVGRLIVQVFATLPAIQEP